MWAGVVVAHGGAECLEYAETQVPEPRPGWVRVRVLACALNMLDLFVRRGMPGVHLQLPHIPGGDIVGVIDALGEGVSTPAPGALVLVDPMAERKMLGENIPGGLAEYAVVPAANALTLEAELSDVPLYAALPVAYGTARRLLFSRARVASGETVAVLGAAGGVGLACIQLGSAAGARMIACSSSAAKLARLGQLGATELVDTTHEDFSAQIWQLTARRGADVVVDYLGADTWPGSIKALRRGGRLVTCGASTGFLAETDLRYVWTRELDILGSDGWERQDLLELVSLVRRGVLKPEIHGLYRLSQVRAALAELEERRAVGKVVVVPDSVAQELGA
jgi:NADPH:quinone reductase-like Zn-dependent oxidoreductase